MTNNYFDYRNISSIAHKAQPSFMNIIRPKRGIASSFLSKESMSNINNFINGAQKVVRLYDQAMPIIKQTTPMINNIKTTFRVAKAFKSFSNENSLEKAFDNLPDFDEIKEEVKVEKKENNQGGNPFYPQ